MARKSSHRLSKVPRPATYAQLQEARAELRETIAHVRDLAERFTKITDIQFERIAQIQAELDEVRTAWTRPRGDAGRTRNPAAPYSARSEGGRFFASAWVSGGSTQSSAHPSLIKLTLRRMEDRDVADVATGKINAVQAARRAPGPRPRSPGWAAHSAASPSARSRCPSRASPSSRAGGGRTRRSMAGSCSPDRSAAT